MRVAEKEKGVGLLVTFDLNGVKTAILQKRGEFSTERMDKSLWAGGCQVTVHGKLNADETFWDALDREIKEDLGLDVSGWIRFSKFPTPLVYEIDTAEKLVQTFAIHMENPDFLKAIQWHASSGGMKLVTAQDLPNIVDLKKIPKCATVRSDVIAMFLDELEALKKVLI